MCHPTWGKPLLGGPVASGVSAAHCEADGGLIFRQLSETAGLSLQGGDQRHDLTSVTHRRHLGHGAVTGWKLTPPDAITESRDVERARTERWRGGPAVVAGRRQSATPAVAGLLMPISCSPGRPLFDMGSKHDETRNGLIKAAVLWWLEA